MEKQSSKDTRKCESDGASIPRASTSSESDKEVNRLTDEIPDAMSIATRGANGKTGKSSSSSGGGGSSSKEKGHGEGSHYSSDALDLAFPWRNEFRRRCVLALVEPSVNKLDELMAYYIDKFSADLKACYSKPNRAAKLKKTLNDVMLFFYFHYKDLNEPLENSVYLEKMSTLLTFYMDMSIKTSRKKNDDESEIVNSLLVALYLYLDGSPEFILDTILRSKFVSKAHRLFCIPIFIRLADDVLTKTGDKPPPTTTTRPTTTKKEPRNKIVMYVRYILMFKLWKKIVRGAEQRRRVNQLASTQLRAPDDFREALKRGGALADLLPTVPKAKTNITEYYMRAKFNIKEKIKEFFKLRPTINKQFELVNELDKAHFFSVDSPDLEFVHTGNNLYEVGSSRLDMMMDEYLAEYSSRESKELEAKDPAKEKEKEKKKESEMKTAGEQQHNNNNKGLNKKLLEGPSEVQKLLLKYNDKLQEGKCAGCSSKAVEGISAEESTDEPMDVEPTQLQIEPSKLVQPEDSHENHHSQPPTCADSSLANSLEQIKIVTPSADNKSADVVSEIEKNKALDDRITNESRSSNSVEQVQTREEDIVEIQTKETESSEVISLIEQDENICEKRSTVDGESCQNKSYTQPVTSDLEPAPVKHDSTWSPIADVEFPLQNSNTKHSVTSTLQPALEKHNSTCSPITPVESQKDCSPAQASVVDSNKSSDLPVVTAVCENNATPKQNVSVRDNRPTPPTQNISISCRPSFTESINCVSRNIEGISIKTETTKMEIVNDINENVTVKRELMSPGSPSDADADAAETPPQTPPERKAAATLEEMLCDLFIFERHLAKSRCSSVNSTAGRIKKCFMRPMKFKRKSFIDLQFIKKIMSQKPTEGLFLKKREQNQKQPILRKPILKNSVMDGELQTEDTVSGFTTNTRKTNSIFQEQQVYFGMKASILFQNTQKLCNSWTKSPFTKIFTPGVLGMEYSSNLSTFDSLVDSLKEENVENLYNFLKCGADVKERGLIKLKKFSDLERKSTEIEDKTDKNLIVKSNNCSENVSDVGLNHCTENVIEVDIGKYTENVESKHCAEKSAICSNLSTFLCVCDNVKGCHGMTQIDNIPKSVEAHQMCDDLISKYSLLKEEILQPPVNEAHCLIPYANDIIVMKDSFEIGAIDPKFDMAVENLPAKPVDVPSLDPAVTNNSPPTVEQPSAKDIRSFCEQFDKPANNPHPNLQLGAAVENDSQLSAAGDNDREPELIMDICSIGQEIEISSEPKYDEFVQDGVSPSKVSVSEGVTANIQTVHHQIETPASPVSSEKDSSSSDNNMKKVPSIKIKLVKNNSGQSANSGQIIKSVSGEEGGQNSDDENVEVDSSSCRSRKKKKRRHKERRHRRRHHRCAGASSCERQKRFRPPSPPNSPPPSPPPPPPSSPPPSPPPPPPPPPSCLPPSQPQQSCALLPSESCTTPVTYAAQSSYPLASSDHSRDQVQPTHSLWNSDCDQLCYKCPTTVLDMTTLSIDELTEASHVHVSTTNADVRLCTEQYKLIESPIEVTPSTLIPCPPPHIENGRSRCPCMQCDNNYNILMSNFKKIRQFCEDQLRYRGNPANQPFHWEHNSAATADNVNLDRSRKNEVQNNTAKEPEIKYKLMDGIKFRKYEDDDITSQTDNNTRSSANDSDSRDEQLELRNLKSNNNYRKQDCTLPLKKRRKLTSSLGNDEVNHQAKVADWEQSASYDERRRNTNHSFGNFEKERQERERLQKERQERERLQKEQELERYLEAQKELKLQLEKQLELERKRDREKQRQLENERNYALVIEKQRQQEIERKEAMMLKKKQLEEMQKRKKLAQEEFQKMKRRQAQQKQLEEAIRQKQQQEQKNHSRRTTHQKVVTAAAASREPAHSEPAEANHHLLTPPATKRSRRVESSTASATKAAETLLDFAIKCSKLPPHNSLRIATRRESEDRELIRTRSETTRHEGQGPPARVPEAPETNTRPTRKRSKKHTIIR